MTLPARTWLAAALLSGSAAAASAQVRAVSAPLESAAPLDISMPALREAEAKPLPLPQALSRESPLVLAPLLSAPAPKDEAARDERLFDRRTPTGREILDRAGEAGLGLRTLGAAIQEAPTLEHAAATMVQFGVLSKEEGPRPGRGFAFETALRRVWYEAAPTTTPPYGIDRDWAVPALVVEANGVRYFIHPVVHGPLMAVRPKAVRALVRGLEARGLPLYSEQELPWLYGFSWGKETLDQRLKLWRPAELRDVPFEDAGQSVWRARSAIKAAVVAGLAGVPAAIALAHPGPLAWAAAALGGTAAWTVAKSLLPLLRAEHRLLALASLLGPRSGDLAHQMWVKGETLFGGPLDPEALRRVEFPAPLRSEARGWETKRSEAIADLARADAERRGLREAHLLVGFDHAQEIAWRLAQGPRP